MSLFSDARPVSLERLGPEDLVETFGFLDRDPVLNVYLVALAVRDALGQPREEFWAARREGEMVGLIHLGGQTGAILPIGDDPDALRALAEQVPRRLPDLPRRFQVIGPRAAVQAVVTRLADEPARPRLAREQVYMDVDRQGLGRHDALAELRPARWSDYALVFESGAMLRREELEEDPRECDPLAYARRVEEECRDGYTYVWLDELGLRFRASISARTPDAAQVSGVYVPPERRGEGFARRGLAELCARLFEHSRSVCLFVNDFNAPALAVYRRLGFTPRAQWASAFYDLRA